MDTPFDTLPGGEEYRQWQRRVSACCATAHEWFDAHPCTRQFGEAYAYLVEVEATLGFFALSQLCPPGFFHKLIRQIDARQASAPARSDLAEPYEPWEEAEWPQLAVLIRTALGRRRNCLFHPEHVSGPDALRSLLAAFADMPLLDRDLATHLLLDKLADHAVSRGKSLPQPIVPRWLARLMIRLAAVAPGETVCDPSMGYGNLLAETALMLPVAERLQCSGQGGDSPLGILLPYLSGVAALTSNPLADLPPERGIPDATASFSIADKVLCGLPDPGQDVAISAGTAARDDAMHIVYRHLNELKLSSGRAVLLAHMRLLFREDEDAARRNDLLGKNLLDAVILLPGNVMLGDTTARALLFFDRRRKAGGVRQAEDDVFMLDLSGWGRRSGMQVQLDAGELEKIAAYIERREEVPGISRRVPRAEVLRHNVWLPARYLVQAAPSSSEGIRQLAGRRAVIENDLHAVESKVDALLDKLAAMRHRT